MFTFLPEDYKKEALGEYRVRLAIVCIGLLLAFFAVGCLLTLPIFSLMQARRDSALMERETLTKNLKENPSSLEDEVRDSNAKTSIIKETASSQPLISVLERVLTQQGDGIKITSISLKRGGTASVSVIGVGTSRDSLVAFSKKLQGEPSFTKVSLPIGSLARNKDIPFTIVIDTSF